MLEDMETIAASGTKLNLDYAIDEMLDEYEQADILEYFKGCETSSLQIAQEEMAEAAARIALDRARQDFDRLGVAPQVQVGDAFEHLP